MRDFYEFARDFLVISLFSAVVLAVGMFIIAFKDGVLQ